MYYGIPTRQASLFSRLPNALHWTGEPNDWVRITRPGQSLHSFLEGLTFAADGTAYVADVPYGRVFRVASDGSEWRAVLDDDGEPHGLWMVAPERLWVVDSRRGLRTLDLRSGKVEALCAKPAGGEFLGLSDLAVDADGNVWFTDPGRSSLSDPSGRLFRWSREAGLMQVLDKLPYPNGVAISSDGAHVLVAMTRANAVWKLPRATSGTGKPMLGTYLQLSGGLGPDGLAVGPHGCLAVAHAQAGAAWLFDAAGLPLARIVTPHGTWTTSVRFSPVQPAMLYIVEAQTGSIYRFDCSDLLKEAS